MSDEKNACPTEKVSTYVCALFAIVVIGTGLGGMTQTVLNTVAAVVLADLGADIGWGQWLTTLYIFSMGAAVPLASFLQRKFSIRSLMLIAYGARSGHAPHGPPLGARLFGRDGCPDARLLSCVHRKEARLTVGGICRQSAPQHPVVYHGHDMQSRLGCAYPRHHGGVTHMAFDYKKEYKDLYQPRKTPSLIDVPPINYVAVRGTGNPNVEGGAYQHAMQLLYGISFTIKMSPKSGWDIDGYFPYVVPPLEGFWKQAGADGAFDLSRKDEFEWTSCIRLPEFVTLGIFEQTKSIATEKKGEDYSSAEFLTVDEGLCVQCMHIGPYDDEPATIEAMHRFVEEQGHAIDLTDTRLHHEIYLSDPRRCAPQKLRTVIRTPVS